MKTKMKCYGVNWRGKQRRIVRAKNKKDAAKLFGVSYGYMVQMGCETRNDKEVSLCMSDPRLIWKMDFRNEKAGYDPIINLDGLLIR